ncbi:hypothetical protein ACTXIU_12980 [Glutamicibacter arilaitensis]|uniref:hypothetical protein n=1 Tax=Glutamicibacter arilaitensis TaxID=256701 RepID=UPI003FD43A16
MITITQQDEHDFTTACLGLDGCGKQWPGLYSKMTAEDVARTHFHGPTRTLRIIRSGGLWGGALYEYR